MRKGLLLFEALFYVKDKKSSVRFSCRSIETKQLPVVLTDKIRFPVHLAIEPVEKVQFLNFFKFAFNNIKCLDAAKLPFWGFSTGS